MKVVRKRYLIKNEQSNLWYIRYEFHNGTYEWYDVDPDSKEQPIGQPLFDKVLEREFQEIKSDAHDWFF